MLNFLIFCGILIVATLPAILLFSLVAVVGHIPMFLFGVVAQKLESGSIILRSFAFLGILVSGLTRIVNWIFLSALSFKFTLYFTQKPDVTSDWIYWICGFTWLPSIIGWFTYKEVSTVSTYEDEKYVIRGALLHAVIAITAFVILVFNPQLVLPPNGWIIGRILNTRTQTESSTPSIGNTDTRQNNNSFQRKLDSSEMKSINGFFEGYQAVGNAIQLVAEIPTKLQMGALSPDEMVREFKRLDSLMTIGQEQLSMCNAAQLNNLYAGWGGIVVNKLLPSIILARSAITKVINDDPNFRGDLEKGDSLMLEFNRWMQVNWNPLLLSLNQNYGFEIRQ